MTNIVPESLGPMVKFQVVVEHDSGDDEKLVFYRLPIMNLERSSHLPALC